MSETPTNAKQPAHQRRARYAGKYPRHFSQKYKERESTRYQDTVEKVLASGKTPAGSHRPIMVAEILEVLEPRPGQVAVDCTLGYGGHAEAILPRLQPGGRLLGLDADPIELPRTEARLRALGHDAGAFRAVRSNFAGLQKVLSSVELSGADLILADLGVSSMQLDDPARGFSFKFPGPLDMRMNPNRGQSAAAFLANVRPDKLATIFEEYADEPQARILGHALAGRSFSSTTALADAVRSALGRTSGDEQALSIRRVFQALRIAVNDEFAALDSLLRVLPAVFNAGGRVAILTFHSGEDRRVKKAFEAGIESGVYARIAREVIRPSAEEQRANPRSTPAKLRWAIRS